MSKQRHTLAETFCIGHSGATNVDASLLFQEKTFALRILFGRIPDGAEMVRLPKLDESYRAEAHVYRDNRGNWQPAEIAIREWKDPKQLFIEYSTDYEL
jgi:hypothetical protein